MRFSAPTKCTSFRVTHHLRDAGKEIRRDQDVTQKQRESASAACRMHDETFCARSDLTVPLPQDARRERETARQLDPDVTSLSTSHARSHAHWCAATACGSGESDGRVWKEKEETYAADVGVLVIEAGVDLQVRDQSPREAIGSESASEQGSARALAGDTAAGPHREARDPEHALPTLQTLHWPRTAVAGSERTFSFNPTNVSTFRIAPSSRVDCRRDF